MIKKESMLRSILKLGLPMIISQGILTLMVLCDRFILSLKNPIFAAASTTSGFLAISLSLFFIHFLSFGTSLIARRFGAKQQDLCHSIVNQTLACAILFTPLILLLKFVALPYFKLLGHHGVFLEAELGYFDIILYSQIITLFKTAIENYYIGIQSASCILKANILSFFANAFFSYLFVLGPFESYFSYAQGAGFGTFLSSLLSLLYLVYVYKKDSPGISLKINVKALLKSEDMGELAKQGTFIGLEKFVNSFCFVFFVNLFVFYGHEVSASISTLFSWDQIAYLPLIGIYSAVVSFFSRYLGENNPLGASLSLKSSLKGTYALMLGLSFIFYGLCDQLTGAFLKGSTDNLELDKLFYYSSVFFKTTFLNIFATATSMLFKAALRSLGFSKWCFIVSSFFHFILCVICYIGTHHLAFSPLKLWGIFLIMMNLLGFIFIFKYRFEMKRLLIKQTI